MARLSARRARTSMRLRAPDARDRLAGGGGRLVPPLPFGQGSFDVAVLISVLTHMTAGDLVALQPGTWTGRPEGLSFKDVAVARA